MDLTTVHGHVDRNFLFTHNVDFDLRRTISAGDMWTSAENGGFFECKLKPTQYGSMHAVRTDRRMHGDTIPRSMTILCSLDGQHYRILGEVTRFALLEDGPGGVKFVLVDGDGSCGRQNG